MDWWREAVKQYHASRGDLSTQIPRRQPGSSEAPEQQWWWPLFQAQKDKHEQAKIKTTEKSVTRSNAELGQAGLMTSEANISHSSPQQQNPPPSSSPQTNLSAKTKKKKSKKKKSRSSIPDSSSSATQLVTSIPSEHPDSQSLLAEAPTSDTCEAKVPPSTPTHQQPSSSGVTESFHDNSHPPSDSFSKSLEDTPKQSSLSPIMSQKGSPKDSPKDFPKDFPKDSVVRDMSYKGIPGRPEFSQKLLAATTSLKIKDGDGNDHFASSAATKEISSDDSSDVLPELEPVPQGKLPELPTSYTKRCESC